jgi:predicted phosphoadenosine phosphosulfate sulfurtransferase
MAKKPLGIDVLTAARQRVSKVFDDFPRIYVSFSGGKDSSVMLHLVMDEAIKRNRKVGVLFVDLEGQYKLTIEHIHHMFDLYADYIEPYWVCLPIALRNSVSVYEPKWCCWEPGKEDVWIRRPPEMAITYDKKDIFPFYRYREGDPMEFEEFVPLFGKWYGNGKLTACFVGIRSDESLNRYRTIVGNKSKYEGLGWTTWLSEGLYNIYPIYDWKVSDIWLYNSRYQKPYNRLYDLMHQAGLTPSQMRICQPYGDDQRKGLWLFHVIEPETWSKVVARVNGANSGALYVRETGDIMGNIKITKPEGHTWESFAKLLLASMPPATKEHFENKIAVFLKWWMDRGYPNGIPDEADIHLEAAKKVPSWKRICKALLRNDYWCKGLSFSQTKSEAYEKYTKIMKRRRKAWGLGNLF